MQKAGRPSDAPRLSNSPEELAANEDLASLLPDVDSQFHLLVNNDPAGIGNDAKPRACPPKGDQLSPLPQACDQPVSVPCGTNIENVGDTRVIIEHTKGILIVPNEQSVKDKKDLENVTGVQKLPDVDVPGSFPELQDRIAKQYLNKPLTLRKVKEIKRIIQNFYADQGYPFTVVTIPKQCISSRVLQLVLTEAKLGRIVMEGNDYAEHLNQVKNYIGYEPGERISATGIQRSIDFINRNPYRKVNALYAPGKESGTTDLIVPVEERKPWRIYAGADNTGLVRIRRQRLFTGLGINNFMGFDNNINFQYTTAYEPHTFQSYTGQFMIFLPWKHMMNFYGGYSRIHSELPFPGSTNRGTFSQASGRYTIPANITPRVPLEFTFGFDFKRTNTSLLFTEAAFPNSTSAANLSQFVFDLRSGYNGDYSRLEVVAELYYSPRELLPDETVAQYDALRPGASPSYVYGKGAIRYTQWLPLDFEMIIWLRGQLSNQPLLPSEQYGLGGHDTVRGYDEYQLSMDNAANVNFEIRTPGIAIISQIRKWKKKDALQFLVFADYGVGRNKNLFPGQNSPSTLVGVGPGVRYTLDPTIAIRFDWGWKGIQTPPHSGQDIPYTGGKSEVHFSGTLSY